MLEGPSHCQLCRPGAGCPALYKKASWPSHEDQRSEHHSFGGLCALLQFLPPSSCLGFLLWLPLMMHYKPWTDINHFLSPAWFCSLIITAIKIRLEQKTSYLCVHVNVCAHVWAHVHRYQRLTAVVFLQTPPSSTAWPCLLRCLISDSRELLLSAPVVPRTTTVLCFLMWRERFELQDSRPVAST